MKEYNRTTKKYEEVDKNGSLKKPDKCKGKRDHDFVLLIPKWIGEGKPFSKEDIAAYYDIEEKREATNQIFNEQLQKIGITSRGIYVRSNRKFYRCAVCLKEKYE